MEGNVKSWAPLVHTGSQLICVSICHFRTENEYETDGPAPPLGVVTMSVFCLFVFFSPSAFQSLKCLAFQHYAIAVSVL